MSKPEPDVDTNEIQPFDWLTSAESLRPYIRYAIAGKELQNSTQTSRRRAVHIGCGSSTLGEHLLLEPEYGIYHVLNIDQDQATLDHMQRRWNQRRDLFHNEKRLEDVTADFQCADFCSERIEAPSESIDLVFDKGTLDCALCSDKAAACLLVEVYRLLLPISGVYFIVSFHEKEMLLPLLEGIPGADWSIEHFMMERQVETFPHRRPHDNVVSTGKSCIPEPNRRTWSSGSFDPSENYRFVNLFLCRKMSRNGVTLNLDGVNDHIYSVNDNWYKLQNPMVTSGRIKALKDAYRDRDQLDLRTAYNIIFTDLERENLAYDNFLEDWEAYVRSRPELPKDTVSLETAVDFLEEMQ